MNRVRLVLVLFLVIQCVFCYQTFCKCECSASDYTIVKLDQNSIEEDVGNNICLMCTKQFCIDNKYCKLPESSGSDTSTGGSNSAQDTISISCFQRESLKDKLIVYGFILLVFSLFFYAVLVTFIIDKFGFVKERLRL
ncbi:hypothetical protein PACTADRAFT_4326 [Pachysolen tannophilus NRRL Y-2460]|uniref:Uncharacterized protein n=1 Tax=Pachysolen tannophilus NRRL Y-2460 TaxID=669874 RepID=A0A1E4TRJ7_PACTA|nr:hypothetical protein PACTADRAFT_4326 [Pachysolen tannophilus NRRL Y-2460]